MPCTPPLAAREHGWQAAVAGRDRAHPVDSTLDTRPPPYHAHEAAAHLKQALRGAAGGRGAGAPAGSAP